MKRRNRETTFIGAFRTCVIARRSFPSSSSWGAHPPLCHAEERSDEGSARFRSCDPSRSLASLGMTADGEPICFECPATKDSLRQPPTLGLSPPAGGRKGRPYDGKSRYRISS